ncbi:MAG: SUMF1/EgtB/PvdO family nonheme iron enzyme [Bacteroidetes bacterium]|nr:SUMF1/EgtB/PvdO family nonheme iron enzyme [Bacteroidota bacterium]
MKNTVMNLFTNNKFTRKAKNFLGNRTLRSTAFIVTVMAYACGPADTGDLTGVLDRRPWFHPQPPGMVNIPSGTFHTGQGGQDVFNSYLEPNKQMTITSFWMDETEITNNEYRQFVNYVIDSLARISCDDDEYYFPEDEEGNRLINPYRQVDWIKHKEELSDMYYQGDERFQGKHQIDTRKLIFHFQWTDFATAAAEDQLKYAAMNRSKFMRNEDVLVYPDTLCWVRDFTYSYNEPMAQVYFHHPKYDEYPVVGVTWHQAFAFCRWRTDRKTAFWEMNGYLPNTHDFRLPSEYEWEYAARGGRIGNKYPWGGPYARNSKGCPLANFKPLRGNYGVDGGVYPVRVDSYFPNDFGLYNMAGNVSEWTSTSWDEANNAFAHDLNGESSKFIKERGMQGKIQVKDININEKRKVIRGGSWKDIAYFIENGARTSEYQDTSKSYVGFRCVQTYIGRSNKDRQ